MMQSESVNEEPIKKLRYKIAMDEKLLSRLLTRKEQQRVQGRLEAMRSQLRFLESEEELQLRMF